MKARTAVIVGAILLASVTRAIPHPWNVWPITAIAIFGAATLSDKRLAIILPLLALLISDMAVEVSHRLGYLETWGLHRGMWATWLSTVLATLLGLYLRRHRSVVPIATATLAGSLIFFVVTNFAVWLGDGLYPHTLKGLATCYVMAIPFFWNNLLGDAVYVTAFFGAFALAEKWFPVLRETPVAVPAAVQV